MNGLLQVDGRNLQDVCYGYDLKPFGYVTFQEAKNTWDWKFPPMGLYRVAGAIYEVIDTTPGEPLRETDIQNNRYKFTFWDYR